MKAPTLLGQVLLPACMAAVLTSAATPPAAVETLEEISIPAETERERERRASRVAAPSYVFTIRRGNGVTKVELVLRRLQPQVRFRHGSSARRLAPEIAPTGISMNAFQVSGEVLKGFDKSSALAALALDDNVGEVDGIPASLEFGPHSSLVNLEYLRLSGAGRQTAFSLTYAINPQTRRCERQLSLLDDVAEEKRNRFVLVNDSLEQCQRTGARREGGDLLFAEDLPEQLRQDVLALYGPIAVGIANRLGSEPGLLLVGWWPESPYDGATFVPSWDRNSLLLFHGASWQQGLGPQLQGALRLRFENEQIERRLLQPGKYHALTESAIRYLLALYTAEQARSTGSWLAASLPGWIEACARQLDGRSVAAARGQDLASIDCGLVVQFVYDAVARARSAGRASLFDTWRQLLDTSFRRRQDGANPEDFLASSGSARRIVQSLLEGAADWQRFAADLDGLGVKLRIAGDAPAITTAVLSLAHFRD